MNLPISAFADNFNFKVINATRCWDRICCANTCCILVIFALTCAINNSCTRHFYRNSATTKQLVTNTVCAVVHAQMTDYFRY
jgi:hypothetical protein